MIHTGIPLGLYNTVEKDFLFYDPREWGINLKWIRDKGKFNKSWWDKVRPTIVETVSKVGGPIPLEKLVP